MCALLYQGSIPTQSFALLEHPLSQYRTSDTCKTVHRWVLNNLATLSRSWFLDTLDRAWFDLLVGLIVPSSLPFRYQYFVSQKSDKDSWRRLNVFIYRARRTITESKSKTFLHCVIHLSPYSHIHR